MKAKAIDVNKTLPWLLLGGAAAIAGGVYLGKKIQTAIRDKQSENAGNDVDSNNAHIAASTILAQRARAAMYSTPYKWFPDGTNEKELYRVATQLYQKGIPFSTFTGVYKKLYAGDSFVKDIQGELRASELQIFYDHLKGYKTLNGFGNIMIPQLLLQY